MKYLRYLTDHLLVDASFLTVCKFSDRYVLLPTLQPHFPNRFAHSPTALKMASLWGTIEDICNIPSILASLQLGLFSLLPILVYLLPFFLQVSVLTAAL